MLKRISKLLKSISANDTVELHTLKQIVNLLPGHVYWYDKNGVFYGCNDQQARAFGFGKSQDLIGKNGYEMQESLRALEELKKVNEQIYQTGQMQTVEERGTYYNGREIVFLSKKLPWRDRKGKILGIIGISFDITERKKHELELLIYAQIINALPGHVYWRDKQGVYLGCNLQQAQSLGLAKSSELIGKTDYEISSKEIADFIRKTDSEVIKTGKKIVQEEPSTIHGEPHIMLSEKAPLLDEKGAVIGILGISLDITEEKKLKAELEKAKNLAENTLRNIIEVLPGHVYWYDRDGIFWGCNDQQAQSAGYKHAEELIGKSAYEIQTPENAKILREVNERIFKTGQPESAEEPYLYKDGKKAIFLSKKTPLRDERGEIIGIVGISFDITDQKEKESLEIQREADKKIIKAREGYKKQAEKAAHDIRSPVGGIGMIIEGLRGVVPEKDFWDIKDGLNEINIIATDLLDYDEALANPEVYLKERQQTVFVSAILSQVLSMKKQEFKKLPIKFESEFNEKAYAAFIQIEPTALKRSLSNIINNARDAFEGKEGHITLKLDANKDSVKITVEDNGKGMPSEIVKKIMTDIEVTYDKSNGHGFGLGQVREALERNQGKLDIASKVGEGTKITLSFPRVKVPAWFAEEIIIGPQDLIIVLDDDATIHNGWDAHFKDILPKYPGIRLEHLYEGSKAIELINNANAKVQQKMLLLADYELLGQSVNGLDVIEKTTIKRALLVTSHYEKADIQSRAISLNTKIVPKQSITEISIKIDENFNYAANKKVAKQSSSKVDIIVVDDDEKFAERLILYFSSFNKTSEYYSNPWKLLESINQYPKDIKICIDNNFEDGIDIKGVEIAKKLHELGYHKLYLFSGSAFQPGTLPEYLTSIVKGDPDFIKKLFDNLEG